MANHQPNKSDLSPAAYATRIHKACVIYAVVDGWIAEVSSGDRTALFHVPQYMLLSEKEVARQARHWARILEEIDTAVSNYRRGIPSTSLAWLSAAYDRWKSVKFGTLTLCTAEEWEQQVGSLRARRYLDIPPYAELLLQRPDMPVAYRHPEYMLARDLELLYNLAYDAENLVALADWRQPQAWATAASENCQALNRSVIQACFNLLESFTSGIGRGHVMTTQGLTDVETSILLKNHGPPVDERLLKILQILTGGGTCGLAPSDPPLKDLFGRIKHQRNAFVHCEPGPQPTKAGYVKEAIFHDVPWKAAKEAVDLTLATIKQVWNHLHGRDKPTWLTEPGPDGKFPRTTLRVEPPVGADPGQG
jgi:hypothetical protein